MPQTPVTVDVIRGPDSEPSRCTQSFDKATLKYKAGNGRLVLQGSFRIDSDHEAEHADRFKPIESGAQIEIFGASNHLVETILLPGGAMQAKGAGWKSNRTGDVLTYINKDRSAKVKKLQLKRKDRNDSSRVDLKVMTNNLGLASDDVAGEASIRFRLLDNSPGHCSKTAFTPENGGFCASNRSGTALTCRQ